MRPGIVWRLAHKEIISTIRDTRAIVSNLLIPVLFVPIMMLGIPLVIGGLVSREQVTVTQVGAEGLANVPAELRAALEAAHLELVNVDDAKTAVQGGEYDVAIVVPAEFGSAIAEGRSTTLALVSKVGNMKSELSSSKVQQAVAAYQNQIVSGRLQAAGMDPALLHPVGVTLVDASTTAERGSGQLSWLIPFFIAIWTLTGGQMTAVDATAGEKERGTLEVLLVAPVKRSEVVIGKFVATMLFGLSAATMAIVGFLIGSVVMMRVFLPRLGEEAGAIAAVMGGNFAISPLALLQLLVSALFLAGFVAALLLGIAMFARSFKEAQSYVAPLSFLFIVPAIALQFKDLIGLSDVIYYVPVLNALLLMDNLVRGSATFPQALVTWAVMLIVVVLLLRFALRNFQHERVIFRT